MKDSYIAKKRLGFKAALILFISIFALYFALFFPFIGGRVEMNTVQASAYGDVIEVQSYEVELTVNANRKVEIQEKIRVKFLASGLTMFYRSLPLERARYTNITASCAGNGDFSYYVQDNPDMSDFIDINCVGGVGKGIVWTYELSYTVEHGGNEVENGMHIDVIGYGWSVPLNNVSVQMHFPATIQTDGYTVYSGGYGASGNEANVITQLSDDRKTLSLNADRLDVVYNDYYGERMAEGVSVQFTLGAGVLEDYTSTRIFTRNMDKIVFGAAIAIVLALLVLLFMPAKKEIITTVNIKAPDEMDPMEMGKLIDGTVDNEDVTSMLYYFAHKGYLTIDLIDEDDPRLIQKVAELPKTESVHARTLFSGLFARADREVIEGKTPFDEDTVVLFTRVSRLKYKFYESADKAIKQTPKLKMYEPKSVLWYALGGIIGLLYGVVMPLIASFDIGGDYSYMAGIAFALPIIFVLILGLLKENYRYKWKKSAVIGMTAAQVGVAVLFVLIFIGLFGSHVLTGYEKLVVCVGALLPTFFTLNKLSRTEKYRKTLGQILGFKEFIVVTEADKIKFMLEEDAELYYKVLPYAQILGVTNEWEEKFENITLAPPTWCMGSQMTYFDYIILNRCMTRAMITALARPQGSGGGSFVGRSGGGGSFGGFGGGGFGGGGGGAR